MKIKIRFLLLAAVAVLAASSCIGYYGPYGGASPAPTPPPSQPSYNDNSYGNYDTGYFYNELQPYGAWVSYRPYGYVWIPRDVGYGWRPYTAGHWAWTDYGWTWVSLENWGWIVFHYGRWGFDQGLGWFWVPDTVWGPAWVAWRWGDVDIGWAPLPPGLEYYPGRGFGRNQWDIPGHYWNFVRGRDFMDRRVDRWILPVERNITIINMTRLDVNINERDRHIYNPGVDLNTVERWSGRPVSRFSLKDSTRPGPVREEGTDLIVPRPVIKRNETVRPKQVVDQATAERQLNPENAPQALHRDTRAQEEAVQRQHEQEMTLMKQSQQAEINEVRKQTQEQAAKVRNPVEKRKIEAQAQARVQELQKKHEQEKADLEKRQKIEKDKAKQAPVRRKTGPDKTQIEKD